DYSWVSTGQWWEQTPVTISRWLTFMPKPGVTRDQVRIVSSSWPGLGIDRVHLHELTMKSFVHGDDGGGGTLDEIWADHCSFIGAGPGTEVHFAGWNPGWKAKYWTDVVSSDNGSSVPGGAELLRNVTCARNSYGLAYPGLAVNCSWDILSAFGT